MIGGRIDTTASCVPNVAAPPTLLTSSNPFWSSKIVDGAGYEGTYIVTLDLLHLFRSRSSYCLDNQAATTSSLQICVRQAGQSLPRRLGGHARFSRQKASRSGVPKTLMPIDLRCGVDKKLISSPALVARAQRERERPTFM